MSWIDRKLTERELEALQRAWDDSLRRPNPIIFLSYEPPPTPLKFWALVPGIDT